MRQFILCAFLWSITAGGALAQSCGTTDLIDGLSPENRARLDALVAPHPYPEGNFWIAEKPGSTVHVAGTMHIPDPRLAPFFDKVAPVVDAADLVILEADKKTEAETQKLTTSRPDLFFITQGPTLIDLLGPDDWAIAKARLAQIGIPDVLAAKFQPWYLSMVVGLPPCAFELVKSGKGGLDKMIETRAETKGVPVATLDDAEAVLSLFGQGSEEEQIASLRLILRTSGDGPASIATLLNRYFMGKHRQSWEFTRLQAEMQGMEGADAMFDEMTALLLDGRNKLWQPKIDKLVEGKTALIAVGAAHLSGETGILRSLERAGYTLRPW